MAFGLSSGKSESESGSGGAFNQNVWGGQSPFLQQAYRAFGNLFPQTIGGMQGLTPGAVEGAQDIFQGSLPGWQNQMAGGAYQGMGLQNSLMNSLNQSFQMPSATQNIYNEMMGGQGQTYMDRQKQEMTADAFDMLGQQYANIDQRASGGGLPGSSRHGLLQAQAYEDTAKTLGQNLANANFQQYQNDLTNRLGIAEQADANTLARQNMLSGMIGQQNQAMQQGLGFGQNLMGLNMGQFSPYMAPWQAAGSYANVLGSPVILGSGDFSGFGESDSKSGGLGLG